MFDGINCALFIGDGLILEIHHGGKFIDVGNGQHKYIGGEVH